MRSLLMCLIVILTSLSLSGQDFKKDWERSVQAYAGLTDFKVDISVTMSTADDREVIPQYATQIHKGAEWFIQSDGTQALIGEDYALMVMPELLRVQYFTAKKKDFITPKVFDRDMMKSYLDSLSEIEFENTNSGGVYHITSKNKQINRLSIRFDEATGLVAQLIYEVVTENGDKQVVTSIYSYHFSGIHFPFLREDVLDMSSKKISLKGVYDAFYLTVLNPEL